jgi:cobalt-zinc-cadmium efflux system outer membrane protein
VLFRSDRSAFVSIRSSSPFPVGTVACAVFACALGVTRPAAAWPTLDEVWKASRDRAPESVRATTETILARSDGVGARMSSFDNPSLQILADHGVGATPAGANAGLQANAQLGLPIEFAGQRSARIRSSDALVSWREREQAAAEGRAGGAAIVAYGRAVVARARVEQASQAETQARTEVAWFDARAQAGDATAVDRDLAQTELARHGQSRAEAQIELALAEADLRALTGVTELGEPPADAPSPPMPSAGRRGREVSGRSSSPPALEAFERKQAYWDLEIEHARAERWAPLQVIATGGQDEFGQIRVGGGLAWSLPLVRNNEGAIAHAAEEANRARVEHDAVARAADAIVQGLDEQLARTADAVGELDRMGIPAAEGLVQSTDAAFRAGKLELVRVLNARRDLALMRSRRLDLLEGSWRAYGDLAAILGVLP